MSRIIIGNWKMNLTLAESLALAHGYRTVAERYPHVTVVMVPSLPWLVPVAETIKICPPNLHLASQVVSPWSDGAYTGDVSAKQLAKLVTYCLVGHSERRRRHHESGAIIADQIKQLVACHITPVVCFGETSQDKPSAVSPQITADLGRDLDGLDRTAIEPCLFAYEPLWAIGTNQPATPDYAAKVIRSVKTWLGDRFESARPILYGGSVTEENAQELGRMSDIDGLLVGGASLHAGTMRQICEQFSGQV